MDVWWGRWRAGGASAAWLAGASLAMAHRSELEGRLMAILDPSVPRAGLSRLRTSAAPTISALALAPPASVRAWHAGPPDESPRAQAVTPQPTPAPSAQASPAPSSQP